MNVLAQTNAQPTQNASIPLVHTNVIVLMDLKVMAKHALTLMNARQVTLNVMIMQNVSIQRDHMNAIVTMDTMVMAKTVLM